MSGPRLSIIPAGAIFDRTLEPRDLQVLGLLGIHIDKAGWCRRSQVKMASQLKCGRSSVQRSLENLVTSGWVEKKRPPWSNEEGQPSNSYMYRVVLDRDDFDFSTLPDDGGSEADNSHAKTASEEGECPPVGTPEEQKFRAEITSEYISQGAQQDGHPGAQPYVGTGAQPYVGTKNDPLERPPIERERDARARDRNARFLADFEKRWPTAAADDRQRTAYAAEGLSDEEREKALASIGAFLDQLKKIGRKNVPAGWRYLEEKRWTLLDQQTSLAPGAPDGYPRDSAEGSAVQAAFEIAGKSDLFFSIYLRSGKVYYARPVTSRLLALANTKPRDEWSVLTRQQAAAWDGFLRETLTISRRPLREGDRAPHPWPPKLDGTWSPTGPPVGELSDQDAADFK